MKDQILFPSSTLRNRAMDIKKQQEILALSEEMKLMGKGGDFEKHVLDIHNKIAPFSHTAIGNFMQLSDKTTVLKGGRGVNPLNRYAENTIDKTSFYQHLFPSIVSSLTSKQASPEEFMLKTTSYSRNFSYAFNEKVKSASTYKEVEKAIKRIQSKTAPVLAFDLETFGGTDRFGKQQLDAITEFAFLEFDELSKDELTKGPGFVRQGFVGIQKQDRAKYEELIDVFENNPQKLTVKDRVTLDYLAKVGSEKMAISEDTATPGRFVVDSSPDMKEVSVNRSSILRGLERSIEIGEKQKATSVNGLMQWEKDLAEGINRIQNSGSTIVGHNIKRADIPWLNQFMASASPGFQSYYQGLNPQNKLSLSLNTGSVFDTLSGMQFAMADNQFSKGFMNENLRSILQQENITVNTLEALSRRSRTGASDMASHTAFFDAIENLRVLIDNDVNGESLISQMAKAGDRVSGDTITGQLRAGGNQLFLAQQSANKFNLGNSVGFKIDQLSGKIHTTDGYSIDPSSTRDGAVRYSSRFQEYITRKDKSYTIDSIQQVTQLEGKEAEYLEEMKRIHPALAVNDLVLLKMSAVDSYQGEKVSDVAGASGLKHTDSSYILGTHEEIRQFMNNNMMLYDEKNKDGEFDLVKGAEKRLRQFELTEEDGKAVMKEVPQGNLVKQTIQEGVRKTINEDAARKVRALNMHEFAGAIEIADRIEKLMSENRDPKKSDAQKQREAIEEMMKQSRKVSEIVAKGQPISERSSVLINSFQKILKLSSTNEEYEAFLSQDDGILKERKQTRQHSYEINPKSIDNVLSLTSYAKSMEKVVAPIIKHIQSDTSPGAARSGEHNFLFSRAMQVVFGEMEEFHGGQVGTQPVRVRGIDRQRFDIDMGANYGSSRSTTLGSLLGNQSSSNILSFNIEDGGYNLLNQLQRGKKRKVVDERESKKDIYLLINHFTESDFAKEHGISFGSIMNASGTGEYKSAADYVKNNNAITLARDFVSTLKSVREKDPTAGVLKIPEVQEVIDNKDVNAILNDPKFDYKNVQSKAIDSIKSFEGSKFINLPKVVDNPKNLNNQAAKLVEDFLMDSFDEQQFRGMGYSKEAVKYLKKTRDVRKRDYVHMMEEVLKGASAMDASFIVDQGTGTMLLQKGQEVFDLTDILPKEKITDGMIYTQIGRSKYSVGMNIGVKGKDGAIGPTTLKMQSSIGKVMDGIEWNLAKSVINKQKKGENPSDTFTAYIRKIAEGIRQESSVDKLAEKDARSVSSLNAKQIFNNLGRVENLEGLSFGTSNIAQKELAEVLKFAASGQEYDRANDSLKSVIAKHEKEILSYVFHSASASNDVTFVLDYLSNRQKGKQSADGELQMNIGQHEMENFNSPTRMFERSSDYLRYRTEDALEAIDRHGLNQDVAVGANLRTQVGQAYSSGNKYGMLGDTQTEMIVSRAYIGGDDFASRVYEKGMSLGGENIEISDRIKTTAHIYEGSAVASSRLGDALLSNYDRQKNSAQRQFVKEHADNIEDILKMREMSRVVPEFSIDAEGKIQFTYSKGRLVRKNEEMLTEYGGYGNEESKVFAKYDGALRQGFFTKSGMLATEEEVTKHVYEAAKDMKINIADQESFLQVANKVYDSGFYLERLDLTTNRKMHEDRSEKGMTRFLYAGLGDSSNQGNHSKINALLGDLGLGELKGRVLSQEFFEDLANGNLQGSVLKEMSSLDLTEKEVNAIYKKHGGKDQIREALLKERHELSDFIQNEFKAVYLSQTGDEKHSNAARPLSIATNNMFMDIRGQLLSAGMDTAEAEKLAAEEVAARFNNENVVVGSEGEGLSVKNNRIIMPQTNFLDGSHINFNNAEQVYNSHFGEGSFEKIMANGQNNYVSIAVADDFTGQTGSGDLTNATEGQRANAKGFKIGAREMEWMSSNLISQDIIDHAQKALSPEDFENAYGSITFEASGKRHLDPEAKNQSFFEPFLEKIRKDIYAKNGDDLLIDEKGNWLGEEGKYDDIRVTAEGLRNESGGAVSIKAAKTAYEVKTNLKAMQFNNGSIDAPYEDLVNGPFSFEEKKLKDIDFTSGSDADYLLSRDGVSNDIYGKSTIVDLSEIDPALRQRAGIGDKFAIGAIDVSRIGTEVMQSDPYKMLKEIRDDQLQLEQDKKSLYTTDNHISTIEERIVGNLSSIKQELATHTTGKNSALREELSEIRIEKSATGKANLMPLINLETDGVKALENAKIDGKSILEHHKEEKLMDFRLVSKDHVKAMGLFEEEYMRKALGDRKGKLSYEELESKMTEHLKGGVQIFGHRNPTIYEGSIKPMTMILSDDLKDTQVIDYAAGAVAAKADADGDQIKSVLAAVKDRNGRNVDYLEYQTMLEGDNASQEVRRGFDIYKAKQYHNATDTNIYYRDAVAEDLASIKKMDNDITKRILQAKDMEEGILRPELNTLADDRTREQYHRQYKEVESLAMEKFSQSGNYEADQIKEQFENSKQRNNFLRDAIAEIDPDNANGYSTAVDYHAREMSYLASKIGANKQSAAGQINLPLFKARRVRELIGSNEAYSTADRKMLNHIFEAAEEAFLTPKHNEAKIVDNAMVINEFNEAFRSATGNAYKYEDNGTEKLVDWMEKNLPGRFKEDKLRDIGVGKLDVEMTTEERRAVFQKSANMIQDFFSNTKNIDRLNLSLSVLAQTSTGVKAEAIQDAFVYTNSSKELLNSTIRALAYGDEVRIDEVELKNTNEILEAQRNQQAIHNWKPMESRSVIDGSREVMSEIQKELSESRVGGKALAFGALGIAGATMVAGFVGGNPSEKSTTMAASGMEQDAYQIPMLTDDATATMQQNPNQGYIININAGSPKGAQHAQQAIQQAMAQNGQNTNVNIAMNINDNSGNITDSTIERMLDGLIGV